MTGIRKAAYYSRQISEPKALLNSEQILNILANIRNGTDHRALSRARTQRRWKTKDDDSSSNIDTVDPSFSKLCAASPSDNARSCYSTFGSLVSRYNRNVARNRRLLLPLRIVKVVL